MQEIANENMPGRLSAEAFVPTPEKVSAYMGPDCKIEELHGEFKSAEGRSRIFDQIVLNEEQIRQIDPSFSRAKVRMQLDAIGEALSAEERFFEAQKIPEKKSMFTRAIHTITSFPRRHPVLTTVFLVAVLAGMALNMGWIKGFGLGSGLGSWFGAGAEGAAAAEVAGEGAAAAGVAEAGAAEAVATEAAAATEAVDANAAAVEAIREAAAVPTLDIYTAEHSIIYDGQTYDFEQFKNIWPDILKKKGDSAIKIIRDASSRTVTEHDLRTLFKESGLNADQLKWTDNFSKGAADGY